MALDVFFAGDIRQGLVSAVVMTLETATAHGAINVEFVSGVLAMAKARALAVNLLAKLSAPTFCASYMAMPVTQKLPE